jgi:DNA-binding MarR family transcriptional regulator
MDQAGELDDLLRELSTELGQVYRWAAEQAGVNQTDLMSLYYIRSAGGSATPKALAEHLGLTSGATAILLNRLEARGLVQRTPHPTDRRAVLLSLGAGASEKGLLDLRQTVRRLNAAVIDELPPEEAEVVKRFMHRLLANTRDSLRRIRTQGPDSPEQLS